MGMTFWIICGILLLLAFTNQLSLTRDTKIVITDKKHPQYDEDEHSNVLKVLEHLNYLDTYKNNVDKSKEHSIRISMFCFKCLTIHSVFFPKIDIGYYNDRV